MDTNRVTPLRNNSDSSTTGSALADRRIWMLALAAFLVGVWAVGTLTREPWPAVIFPSFASVLADAGDGDVTVNMFVLHSESESVQVSAGDLFIGAFDSFHNEMIDSMVETDSSGSAELEAWFSSRAADELGWSECVQQVDVVEAHADPGADGDHEIVAELNQIEFASCG